MKHCVKSPRAIPSNTHARLDSALPLKYLLFTNRRSSISTVSPGPPIWSLLSSTYVLIFKKDFLKKIFEKNN